MAGQMEEESSGSSSAPPNPSSTPVPAPQPKYKRNVRQKKFVNLDDPTVAAGLKDATGNQIDTLKKDVLVKHEGDAQSMFTKLSPILNGLAGNSGEKSEVDVHGIKFGLIKFIVPARRLDF
jgi:hypothetical protein